MQRTREKDDGERCFGLVADVCRCGIVAMFECLVCEHPICYEHAIETGSEALCVVCAA